MGNSFVIPNKHNNKLKIHKKKINKHNLAVTEFINYIDNSNNKSVKSMKIYETKSNKRQSPDLYSLMNLFGSMESPSTISPLNSISSVEERIEIPLNTSDKKLNTYYKKKYHKTPKNVDIYKGQELIDTIKPDILNSENKIISMDGGSGIKIKNNLNNLYKINFNEKIINYKYGLY